MKDRSFHACRSVVTRRLQILWKTWFNVDAKYCLESKADHGLTYTDLLMPGNPAYSRRSLGLL